MFIKTKPIFKRVINAICLSSMIALGSGYGFSNELNGQKPDWAKNNYHADSGLDFIGLSQLWVAGVVQAESKSIAEACTNGLGKVSEFFSVEIASKSTSSQVVVDDEFQGKFQVNTDKISRIQLQGVGVSDSYSELVQGGEYIQSYCLYRLTPNQVANIRQNIETEKKEIRTLVAKIASQLQQQELSQARISLALLKAKKNVSVELVHELEQVLDNASKGIINVNLAFEQSTYHVNDILGMQLQANQNLFLYLFVDDGRLINMLLPSPAYAFNLIKKDDILMLPSHQQRQKNNLYKMPVLDDGAVPKLYVIASKKRMLTGFAKSAFNRYLVNDKGAYNAFIASCKLNQDCQVSEYDLPISQSSPRFLINTYDLKINQKQIANYNASLRSKLTGQGFEFLNHGADIQMLINHKKAYSKKFDAEMFVAELNAMSLVKGKRQFLFKIRFSNLYDEARTDFYLDSLLESAVKKLKTKAQNGDLSY